VNAILLRIFYIFQRHPMAVTARPTDQRFFTQGQLE